MAFENGTKTFKKEDKGNFFEREKEAFNEGFIKVNFPQNHQVFLKENLIDSTEMLE